MPQSADVDLAVAQAASSHAAAHAPSLMGYSSHWRPRIQSSVHFTRHDQQATPFTGTRGTGKAGR
jgi:hypothetical protein